MALTYGQTAFYDWAIPNLQHIRIIKTDVIGKNVFFTATKSLLNHRSLYGENFLKKGIANRGKLCYDDKNWCKSCTCSKVHIVRTFMRSNVKGECSVQKRVLAISVALILCLSLFPVLASADEDEVVANTVSSITQAENEDGNIYDLLDGEESDTVADDSGYSDSNAGILKSDTLVAELMGTNSEIQSKILSLLYGGDNGGYVSCDFDGYKTTSGRHEGIDFAIKEGHPVYAIADGVVTSARQADSSLTTIAIYNSTNDVTIIYLHTKNFAVSTGDRVTKGTKIAEEGKNGASSAHTHVELRTGRQTSASKSVNDSTLDNPNPYPYYQELLFATAVAPSKPAISSITANGVSSITVEWGKAKNADSYNVYAKAAGDDNYTNVKSKTTDTSYTLEKLNGKSLDAGQRYWFRIGAVNSVDETLSNESACYTMMEKPTVARVDGTAFKLSWKKPKGATKYAVQRKKVDEADSKYKDIETGVTATSFKDDGTGLASGTEYKYRIVATCTKDDKSWTCTSEAVKVSKPAKPAISSLTSKGTSSIKMTWDKAANATSYNVYAKIASGNYIQVASGISSTSYTLAKLDGSKLESGQRYWFYLEAANDIFTVSSDEGKQKNACYTMLEKPEKKQSEEGTSLQLKWIEPRGAKSYTVQRKKSSDEDSKYVSVVSDLTKRSYTIAGTDLKAGTKYDYRIVAKCVQNESKSWTCVSEPVEVSKPGTFEITKRVSESITSIKIAWSKSEYATSYDVYAKLAGEKTYTLVEENTTSTSYTLTQIGKNNLISGRRYWFYIQANGDVITYDKNKGQQDDAWYTRAGQPTVSRVNDANYPKMTIDWSAVKPQDAVSYTVYRKKHNEDNSKYKELKSGITGTSYIDTGEDLVADLKSDKNHSSIKYYYRVTAVCEHEGRTWEPVLFTAKGKFSHMTAPTLKALSESEVEISWKPVDGDRTYTYTIQRTEDGKENWKDVATNLDASKSPYPDNTAEIGTKYSYRIKVSATDGSTSVTSLTAKVQTWGKLDIGASLDGTDKANLKSFGTFKIYIDGTLYKDKKGNSDVTDYVKALPVGTKYEIKTEDVKAAAGYSFTGVEEGTLSGKVGSAKQTKVKLGFKTSTCTVTFDAGEISVNPGSKTVTYGKTYGTLPTPDSKQTSASFAGWYATSGAQITSNTKVSTTQNHTLTAHWTNIPVTISFSANGGSGSMEEISTAQNSSVVLPVSSFAAPSGQQFRAWSIADKEYKPGDEYTATGNVSITAVYEAIQTTNYTVSFDANGGSGSMPLATVSVNPDESGAAYLLPENGFTAPESGITFKAWNVGGIEYTPGSSCIIEKDTIVVAVWNAKETAEYTISFNPGDGGTGSMSSLTVNEGDVFVFPQNDFTAQEGKEFHAWSVEGNLLYPGDEYNVSNDIAATALWRDVEKDELEQFTVTFEANGGSGTMAPVVAAIGTSLDLPQCGFSAPDGMLFAGWIISEETYAAGTSYTVTDDVTAVAVWKADPEKAADVRTEVTEITASGNVVLVDAICNDKDATVFCIAYDENGQMKALDMKQVDGSGSYAFSFDGVSYDTIKAVILNTNLRPLCGCKTA